MGATKTTFVLDDETRSRMIELAHRRRTSLRSLLSEGATLVLDRYRREIDRARLEEVRRAWDTMCTEGLYSSPHTAGEADAVVYAAPPRRRVAQSRARRRG